MPLGNDQPAHGQRLYAYVCVELSTWTSSHCTDASGAARCGSLAHRGSRRSAPPAKLLIGISRRRKESDMHTPRDLGLDLDDAMIAKRSRHNILSWIGLVLGILFLLGFSLSLPRNLALLPTNPYYAAGGLSHGPLSLAFFVLWYRSGRRVDAIDTKLKAKQPTRVPE